MSKGWILLHRQMLDCFIWDSEEKHNERSAWIDLLLLANHRDKETDFNGKPFTIKRGQYLTSVRKLSARWHWDKNKTLRYLRMLEAHGMIVKESDEMRTLLTIVNYGFYQDLRDSSADSVVDTIADSSADTSVPQTKNVKNIKNEKNEINNTPKGVYARFVPPTLDEVKKYCAERNNTVDAEKWFDFYESKGWMIGKNKMKDWKSAVRTWERSSNSNGFRSTEDEVSTSKYPSFKLWD